MSIGAFCLRLRSRRSISLGLVAIGLVVVAAGVWWKYWPEHLLERARQEGLHENWRTLAGYLERYVFWRPHDSAARLLLAKAYLGIGRHRSADALRQLAHISDDDPHAVEARVHSGEILKLGLHRAADAERMYRRALELDPKSIAARQGLYSIYWWEQRRTPEVLQWLEDIYQLGTPRQRLLALVERFWFYYAEFPPDAALPLMQQFLRSDVKDFGARVGLARCLLRLKRYDQGTALLHEILGERPADGTARSLLADHYLERGMWPEVRPILDQWPAETRDWNYWELRGRHLEMADNNWAEAVECFEQVLAVRPDRWAARHRLSRCLEAIGDRERAETERLRTEKTSQALLSTRVEHLLNEVLPSLESRPETCRLVGEFYDELGLAEEARRWYEMELELRRLAKETRTSEDTASSKLEPPGELSVPTEQR